MYDVDITSLDFYETSFLRFGSAVPVVMFAS